LWEKVNRWIIGDNCGTREYGRGKSVIINYFHCKKVEVVGIAQFVYHYSGIFAAKLIYV